MDYEMMLLDELELTKPHKTVDCPELQQFNFYKLAFTLFCGAPLASFGIYANFLLIKIFCNKEALSSWKLYLFVLAIADLTSCACYIMFRTIFFVGYYFRIYFFYSLWHNTVRLTEPLDLYARTIVRHMILLFVIEHVIQLFKRERSSGICSTKLRLYAIGGVLLVDFLPKIPMLFSLYIVNEPSCPPFQNYRVVIPPFYDDYAPYHAYLNWLLPMQLGWFIGAGLQILIVGSTSRFLANRISSNIDEKNSIGLPKTLLGLHLLINFFTILILLIQIFFPSAFIVMVYDEDSVNTNLFAFTLEFHEFIFMFDPAIRIFVYYCFSATIRRQIDRIALFMSYFNRYLPDPTVKDFQGFGQEEIQVIPRQ
ncbi:unnamed protein product, partial [Mesorhabditis belari]|uniref:G-protein coupled receptors family 1 profile domain-containing protein n=1 Tax=Mesorhabditis belari TaxID=2138241 RepID=A0AAF3F3E4_9BILA